jgi:ADP-ribose pyrophosphatase
LSDSLAPPLDGRETAERLSYADVEVQTREQLFRGYFAIDRYRLRHRLHQGGWSETVEREIFERGQAAAVVLYDPERDALVLIEQFRPGVLAAADTGQVRDPGGPWLIEIVAGIIGPGETADEVARREAMEEAGCLVDDIEFLCRIFASPGASSETISLFFARTRAPDPGAVHGLAHEHEDIRLLVERPDQVYRWIDEGRIVNGPALLGLLWFRLHEQRLRY